MSRKPHPYNWIEEATAKRHDALRDKLHVKPGHDIPEKTLEKAEHSKSPTERKEADLAATLRGFHGTK